MKNVGTGKFVSEKKWTTLLKTAFRLLRFRIEWIRREFGMWHFPGEVRMCGRLLKTLRTQKGKFCQTFRAGSGIARAAFRFGTGGTQARQLGLF